MFKQPAAAPAYHCAARAPSCGRTASSRWACPAGRARAPLSVGFERINKIRNPDPDHRIGISITISGLKIRNSNFVKPGIRNSNQIRYNTAKPRRAGKWARPCRRGCWCGRGRSSRGSRPATPSSPRPGVSGSARCASNQLKQSIESIDRIIESIK